MVARGATSFAKDVQNGVYKEYNSWPGTDRPWEQDDIPAPPFDGGIPYQPPHIEAPGAHSEDTTNGSNNQLHAMMARVSSAVPGASFDPTNPWDSRFGNGTSSFGGLTPRNPNAPASPPESEGPIGLFSRKPMRFPFAPIFQARMPSDGGPDRRSAWDDLIWNGLGSRAFSSDADTAQQLLSDRRISSAFGNGSDSSPNNSDPSFTPPISPEDSQEPLSLNNAYLEYLRRLGLSQS